MVGLTMVFVEEMVQVTRCFNCNGLGHIPRSCKQKPKCHKCDKEGHKIKECRAEKSECGNYKQTGHRAYDKKCPPLKRALEWKIARPARCWTMDAKTQEECPKRKKAVVGLTFLGIEKKIEVNRCFNCHGCDHQKKDCRQELTCYKCGGAHIKKDCKAEKTCPNCVREGRKEVNHWQMVPGVPTEAGDQVGQNSTQLSLEEESRDVRDPRGTQDKFVVLQANLGRGKEATDLLQKTAEENEADVELIQEGYCYMPTWVGWTKYEGGRTDKIATLVRAGRRSIELTQFTEPTIRAVVIEGEGGDIPRGSLA
jgi:hypothetical protein